MEEELFKEYPSLVTADMNDALYHIPTKGEIWDGVSSMSLDSAPGEDRFT